MTELDPTGRDPHEAGEMLDEDTELRHAAHLAWNALARLDLMLREGA